MLRGYYTAASGMKTQQRRQDTLSNNIANAQTPGFKQDQATVRAFPEHLVQRMGESKLPTTRQFKVPFSNNVGPLTTGVYVQETLPDHTQGSLMETGMTTDVALTNGTLPDENGALLFTVQNNDGDVRYTRSGNFTVDGEGFLTNNRGQYVLADNGEPIFTDGQTFQVSPEGVLEVGGEAIPLQMSYTANHQDLIKDGEDLFMLEDEGEVVNGRGVAGLNFSVTQGYLESSNVDEGQTMVEMMQAYRLFETNQQVLRAYDQSMDIAVNQIGRLT
ncbi:flagellar basal-body rod protein FlgG [Streptohalobacillus salinus]|uniref:Flagellar basal-body rod protein FlgG n=1 Tax=Streptohalobacillus salinus TaxID=621096 RepID=A0A2V3WHV6_9BACI|nr:flagellar hook-basal body protein [Streptohalobacillus salinus]PXW92037.1 flagellar basal-body rod protein FlgG [Streptohalobacillus salinus]